MIGRQGIEKAYEDELRGKKGFQFFQKDRFNWKIAHKTRNILNTIGSVVHLQCIQDKSMLMH